MQNDETTRDDSRIDSKGIGTDKDNDSQSPLQATFRGVGETVADDAETYRDDRPVEAEQVLTAEYEFSDEPLDLTDVDGIFDAIEEVAETKDDVIVGDDDRIEDFRVYWNDKTETVRIGALVVAASYEVPADFVGGDA